MMERKPLQERLRLLGSSQEQSWKTPLTGENVMGVLEGAGRLAGSEYPMWLAQQLKDDFFYGFPFGDPDGTEADYGYDAIAYWALAATSQVPTIDKELDTRADAFYTLNDVEWDCAAQLLYQLLIEPFCLMDLARQEQLCQAQKARAAAACREAREADGRQDDDTGSEDDTTWEN